MRVLGLAGAAALVLVGFFAIRSARSASSQVCRGADKKLSGVWDAGERGWIFKGIEAGFVGAKQSSVEAYTWKTALTPNDLYAEVLPEDSQPLRAIIQGIGIDKHSSKYKVTLYSRLSYPLVGIALLLTGIPFMLRHESVRRSRLFGTGVCLLIGAAYYLVSFLSSMLGERGDLPGAVAGLLPVLLFAALGIYLTDRIRT
jgi:lipopolysaccharide export LptBFGC system permease protein LptF